MFEGKDEIIVMQEDLKRALSKPNPKWGMLIDLRRCVGCHACTVGCMAEQKSPPGIMYRPLYDVVNGKFPNVKRLFVPRPCQQCDKPPCVEACPFKGKATWKDNNGIVMIDYEKCVGCGRCVIACPYKARMLDGGKFYTQDTPAIQDYEKAPAFEYGKKWPREEYHIPIGNARKCHFCYHRVKSGILPNCVTTCISRATFFGDLGDKDSLICRMIKNNKVTFLAAVKSPGEKKLTKEALKGITPEALAKAIGYPGSHPQFSDKPQAQPRVYYILP